MRKSFYWVSFCLFMVSATFAVAKTPDVQTKDQSVHVKVQGLVCSICAEGLQKSLGKIPGITSVQVDLEKKFVRFNAVPAVTDKAITDAITDAGLETKAIERTPL